MVAVIAARHVAADADGEDFMPRDDQLAAFLDGQFGYQLVGRLDGEHPAYALPEIIRFLAVLLALFLDVDLVGHLGRAAVDLAADPHMPEV